MAKADLSAARLRELLDYNPDTGVFIRKVRRGGRIGVVRTKLRCGGYMYMGVDKHLYQAHRLAWLYVFGVWPSGHIDHINGDPSDNRLCNLRDVTQKVNNQNIRSARKNSKSGLLGAYFVPSRGKWTSQIEIGSRKRVCLGYFDSAQDAHNAYVLAKRRYHDGCTI